MANRYVRKTGSDSNNGTTPSQAWLTIQKALGAAGASSGDTIYIGAGVYRETVTVGLTPAAATNIIGDVDGSHTGDVGEVRWTAYTTNDKTAPSGNATLKLNGKPYLNFQNIVFVGGDNANYACVDADTIKGSDNCSFKDCTFIVGQDCSASIFVYQLDNDGASPAGGIAANLTIDRCRFLLADNNMAIVIRGVGSLASEFNFNVLIQNCLFVGSQRGRSTATEGVIAIYGAYYGGADPFLPGGFRIYNNTCISSGDFLYVENTAYGSYAVQTHPYNNVLVGCKIYNNGNIGAVEEDYNIILTSETPITNCQSGGHSKTDGTYSMLMHIGQEIPQGRAQRHFAQPTSDSPLLGFGGLSLPTYDITNGQRPAGSRQWSNASYAVGCLEYYNNGTKETTTVRSSPTSLKIAGPGYHDFDFPVDPVQTTIGVWTLWDNVYTGTNPQMEVLNGTECGVATATATAAGSANAWNQMTLTFTPTQKGIVTIRLISNDTSATGNAYFDDFSVT